jgi:hypothetical protein
MNTRVNSRPFLLIAIVIIAAHAGAAYGEIVQYHAGSGVLPSSAAIPESQRFTVVGEANFASMGLGELHITDPSTVYEIKYDRMPVVLRDQDVALELTVQVLWADREDINAAGTFGFHDDLRFISLVLCPDRVGFQANLAGTSWLTSDVMDTTDTYHEYRIVKLGQDVVSLFVDGNSTPLLSAAYEDFPLKTATYNSRYPQGVMIPWQGSNHGRGEVSITYFGYNSDGTTVPEPATMSLLALGGIALLRRKR